METFHADNTSLHYWRPGQFLNTGTFAIDGLKERSVRGEPRKPHPFQIRRFQHVSTDYLPNLAGTGTYYPHDVGLLDSIANGLISSTHADLAKAYVSMTADWDSLMPTVFSVGNFIRELAEIIPTLAFLPIRFLTIHKAIAAGVLSWELGWEPMFRDLMKLATLNDAMLQRVLFLISATQQKEGITLKGYRVLQVPFDTPLHVESEHLRTMFDHVDDRKRYYRVRHNIQVYASGRLKVGFSPVELYALYDAGMFLSAALGLLNLRAVVWNALPYTFMIDWVAPIQAAFKSVDGNGSEYLTVDRFTWSQSMLTTAVPSIYCPVPHLAYDQEFLARATITRRSYSRYVGTPPLDRESFSLGGSLNPWRLAIIAALLAAKT